MQRGLVALEMSSCCKHQTCKRRFEQVENRRNKCHVCCGSQPRVVWKETDGICREMSHGYKREAEMCH